MVKLLKQSSISLLQKNTKGQRVDYKGTTNANPVSGDKQYQAWPNEDNRRGSVTTGDWVDDRLRLDTNAFRKTQTKGSLKQQLL